jgi:hypothetical protein
MIKKFIFLFLAMIMAMILVYQRTDLNMRPLPRMEGGGDGRTPQTQTRAFKSDKTLQGDGEMTATTARTLTPNETYQREHTKMYLDPIPASIAPSPFKINERVFETLKAAPSTNKVPTLEFHREDPQYMTGEHNLLTPVTRGYVLAHDYWEQLTSGSRSLFSLQCWASGLNMSVVEPFVKKTDLYSPTGEQEVKNFLKFGDIYDLNYWNALSQRASYSPLIPWEHFVKKAPRNLITVQLKYYGAAKQVPTQDYRHGCRAKGSWNRLVQFLKQEHKFSIVRQICINLSHNEKFSPSEFYEKVFGINGPRNSTVLFGQWRGLSRLRVRDSGCEKPTAQLDVEPSKRVLRDAQRYREQFLKTHNYVAIFARMEKAKQQKGQGQMVTNCFQETLESWRKMTSISGVNTTFLSADVGKYGSASFKMANDNLNKAFSEFFATLYGNKTTVRQWEATFEMFSSMPHPGYIGNLQKAIASQAKCVLFAGGGSFQRHALHLYKRRHARKNWCIHVTKDCTANFHEALG